jgi:hypothetical protein
MIWYDLATGSDRSVKKKDQVLSFVKLGSQKMAGGANTRPAIARIPWYD